MKLRLAALRVIADRDRIPLLGLREDRHLRLRLDPERLLTGRMHFQNVLPMLPIDAMHICVNDVSRCLQVKHRRFSLFPHLMHSQSMHATRPWGKGAHTTSLAPSPDCLLDTLTTLASISRTLTSTAWSASTTGRLPSVFGPRFVLVFYIWHGFP